MDSGVHQSLRYYATTDVGCLRELNEDAVYAQDGLWLVADGMGGHACGEVASQIAVETIPSSIAEGDGFEVALTQAHENIIQAAHDVRGQKGMGTTAVAMQADIASYQIAWVGDSRAYLWQRSRRRLTQLTEDHSFINRLINAGLLTREDAQNHPQKHMITQCLGSEDIPALKVDQVSGHWAADEWILLCSDGLSDELSDRQIASVLTKSQDLKAATNALVEAAKKQGGHDNISVILVASPLVSNHPIMDWIKDKVARIKSVFRLKKG